MSDKTEIPDGSLVRGVDDEGVVIEGTLLPKGQRYEYAHERSVVRPDKGPDARWYVKASTLELVSEPEDVVSHPSHYTSHPSGVECITITEHMGFTLGNALKYIWRADLKHDAVEDLKKARWYLDREIARREAEK